MNSIDKYHHVASTFPYTHTHTYTHHAHTAYTYSLKDDTEPIFKSGASACSWLNFSLWPPVCVCVYYWHFALIGCCLIEKGLFCLTSE